jgi:hypothetical protein
VCGSTSGSPNGKIYQLEAAANKGHVVVRIQLENDANSQIELLLNFPQAMEFRDTIEKAVWTISP